MGFMADTVARLLVEIARVAEKYQDEAVVLEALQEIQNWAIEESVENE